jgi:hypothetical protein
VVHEQDVNVMSDQLVQIHDSTLGNRSRKECHDVTQKSVRLGNTNTFRLDCTFQGHHWESCTRCLLLNLSTGSLELFDDSDCVRQWHRQFRRLNRDVRVTWHQIRQDRW